MWEAHHTIIALWNYRHWHKSFLLKLRRTYMFGLNDRLLKDVLDTNRFSHFPMVNTKNNFPRINVSMINTDEEGNGTYFIEYALAGYSRDEIRLEEDSTTYAGHTFNVLKLTAKKVEGNDVSYSTQNIAYRDIEHSVLISPQDHIKSADYKDGILKVYIERVVEQSKGRSITIS